ncbi:MAG: hypothetical protein ACREC6_15170 [Hyphomicrobiaceae bacterium]
MSTLTLNTHDVSGTAPVREGRPGFWKSLFEALIAARRAEADTRIRGYVAGLSDQGLADLGFTPEEIRKLRDGQTVGKVLGDRPAA